MQQSDHSIARAQPLAFAAIAVFGGVALLLGLALIIFAHYHERAYLFLGLGSGGFIGGLAGIIVAESKVKVALSYGVIAMGIMGLIVGLNYLVDRYGSSPNRAHRDIVIALSLIAILDGIALALIMQSKGNMASFSSLIMLGVIASIDLAAFTVGIIRHTPISCLVEVQYALSAASPVVFSFKATRSPLRVHLMERRKTMTDQPYYIHPSADVSPKAIIGAGTHIWCQVQVREHAHLGEMCNVGKGVYIDTNVNIGSCVKIQNHVSVFEGVTLEDGVFVGPHVCFTNDLFPRAITLEGKLKAPDEWEITPTLVKYGASIGAGSIIVCGITIGKFALIGAGSVVTRDVPPYARVFGNPARHRGYVCRCAFPLSEVHEQDGKLIGWCKHCDQACIIE